MEDKTLIQKAKKLLSDSDEIDMLIEKAIEVFKMSWNRLKDIDKKLAFTFIYSSKVKKRFVNMLLIDATQTTTLLIKIIIDGLTMEFEGTQ